jgi:hypothetical protein
VGELFEPFTRGREPSAVDRPGVVPSHCSGHGWPDRL